MNNNVEFNQTIKQRYINYKCQYIYIRHGIRARKETWNNRDHSKKQRLKQTYHKHIYIYIYSQVYANIDQLQIVPSWLKFDFLTSYDPSSPILLYPSTDALPLPLSTPFRLYNLNINTTGIKCVATTPTHKYTMVCLHMCHIYHKDDPRSLAHPSSGSTNINCILITKRMRQNTATSMNSLNSYIYLK